MFVRLFVCVCVTGGKKRGRKKIGQNCPTRRKNKTAPGELRERS